MPSFPVVVKIGHAHSGIGKVYRFPFVYRFMLLYFLLSFVWKHMFNVHLSNWNISIVMLPRRVSATFHFISRVLLGLFLCAGEGGQSQ